MITTRESINYQFSLIFGYSSPNDIIVGNVLGPGKLTIERLNNLSEDVIRFLRMYNAMLRDYTGSEVFSIEFELSNLDEKDTSISIYPKSMILIPGNFKDCEGLLLALKPETGYLDTHKSKDSVDKVCELFYEVEEFAEHPDLSKTNKVSILNKFAKRFSKKLFADLIEDKWNKKLIGLNYSLPTEEKMLKAYGAIKSDVKYLWSRRPIEIIFSNHDFKSINTQFEGSTKIEHLKYLISKPSSIFIVDKTLKLGTDLLKLANTGTIDEIQEKLMLFLIKYIEIGLTRINEKVSVNEVIRYIKGYLEDLSKYFDDIEKISNEFIVTGEVDELKNLIEKYIVFFKNKLINSNEIYEEISELIAYSLNLSIDTKKKLRANDLNSAFNYFFEINKVSLNLLNEALPKYFTRRRLTTLTENFLTIIRKKFNFEQKPSKVLGNKILEKFEDFLLNQIEINPILTSETRNFNEELITKEFKKMVISSLNQFFENIELTISDLISFAEIQMEKDADTIKDHLKKFTTFSTELNFLLNYVLRYSTINRFLKDEPENEIVDPLMFINKFHRFLEKRFGGINLEWKQYILDWFMDYSKQFFKIEQKMTWNLTENISSLIKYLEEREALEVKSENFCNFLDKYIAKVNDEGKKEVLLDFYKKYEYSIDIKYEFPKYVQNIIEEEIALFNETNEDLFPIDFIRISQQNHFYNFIREYELKYFSKLIPKPVSLILRHAFTEEEKDLFNADLFHVFKFKYWHKKCMFEISDNFKEVYRDWLRKGK